MKNGATSTSGSTATPKADGPQNQQCCCRLAEHELSVMRVNQLDAGVLDGELHGLLRTQLGRACSGLPAGTLERFKPEVDALFNLLLFRFAIWMQRPTPGMQLQGLRYRNERALGGVATSPALPESTTDESSNGREEGEGRSTLSAAVSGGAAGVSGTFLCLGEAPTRTQRLLHGLLSVGVQWAFARLRRHGLVNGWGAEDAGRTRHMIWTTMRRLETLFRLAWLINLLVFLRHGKYASVVDRLVGMRMVHDRADPAPRSINYQFLNRRLLWDHWAKMAYVIGPLIDWVSIRRAIVGGAGRLRREARALGIIGGGGRGGGASSRHCRIEGAPAADDPAVSSCAECGANPAKTPYVTSCGHVFCYYCARVACTVDPRYACPRCGEYLATSRRWSHPR